MAYGIWLLAEKSVGQAEPDLRTDFHSHCCIPGTAGFLCIRVMTTSLQTRRAAWGALPYAWQSRMGQKSNEAQRETEERGYLLPFLAFLSVDLHLRVRHFIFDSSSSKFGVRAIDIVPSA